MWLAISPSKLPSGKGSRVALARTTPASGTARSRSHIAGEKSASVSRIPRARRSTRFHSAPVPAPTSITFPSSGSRSPTHEYQSCGFVRYS